MLRKRNPNPVTNDRDEHAKMAADRHAVRAAQDKAIDDIAARLQSLTSTTENTTWRKELTQ